ncbi:hypothetical protein M404DRAFT_864301 [Pisolithus tinctorius Marx 270]|uniref:Uncharacterized protein n=1 Tax=Pisolithus tinctorius Marx 270 TaxID=870435 RepID=A0A0C3NS60_PISTI|nr:hypothetical protein M404DRAFT_864301 [Pisolithus tinctorius Marx 270]
MIHRVNMFFRSEADIQNSPNIHRGHLTGVPTWCHVVQRLRSASNPGEPYVGARASISFAAKHHGHVINQGHSLRGDTTDLELFALPETKMPLVCLIRIRRHSSG